MSDTNLRDSKQKALEKISNFTNISASRKSSMKETIEAQDSEKDVQNKVDSYIQEDINADNSNTEKSSNSNNAMAGASMFKWIIILIIVIIILWTLTSWISTGSFSMPSLPGTGN